MYVDYIRNNPAPNPPELKQSMIKDADISVVMTVDRKISLPIVVYYKAADQTGEEVLAEVEEIAGHLQTCLTCLDFQSKSSNSILIFTIMTIRLAVSLALIKRKFVLSVRKMVSKALNLSSAHVENARLVAESV